VLVVEWGKTSVDVVEAALAGNDQIRRKLLGVILNKVDIGKLRTYDRGLSSLYDQRRSVMGLGNGDATRFPWRRARNNEKGVKLT
jgi:Mrp family chromosome partitioning ATPase